MRRMLVLLLAFAGAACGCVSSTGGAWISASQFNYREYEKKRVAVMPVVLYELLDPARVPGALLQQAITEQLDVLNIEEPVMVDAAAAGDISFPYTPERLRRFGQSNDYDAVVGATLARFDVRPTTKEWTFTGNIMFVDVARPERRWTLARTWSIAGEPGDSLAAIRVSSALISDFIDVRQALRRGKTSVLLGRDTVVVDPGPALNLDAALVEREESNVGWFPFSQQNVTQFETGSPGVQVDVLAVDDAGIKTLEIVNEAAEKPRQVIIEDQGESRPIYVSHRLSVPLVPGKNLLQAIAVNGIGQRVVRTLEITREALPKGPVELIVVVANQYASIPANQLAPKAVSFIAALQTREGAVFENGARAIALTGADATRETVLRTIRSEWARPGMGKRRVLIYAGRAEMIGGKAYLILYGAEPEYQEIGSISLAEFATLSKFGVQRVVLDVCTSLSEPGELRYALNEYKNSLEWSVVGACRIAVGDKLVAVGEDELPTN